MYSNLIDFRFRLLNIFKYVEILNYIFNLINIENCEYI